jgi:hypothetical protein
MRLPINSEQSCAGQDADTRDRVHSLNREHPFTVERDVVGRRYRIASWTVV